MDLHQNQTQQRDETFNAHTFIDSGVYFQGDSAGPALDSWDPLDPPLSELQCSSLGSMCGGATLGRWSSADFSNTQFFPVSFNESNPAQSFCSPTTPGPSPHYPQTPTISSPGPQIHPTKEMLGFPPQTSTQINVNKPLSSCRHDADSYPVTSNPGQHRPHDTSRRLIPSQTKPVQDQGGFTPQKKGQSPGLPAGLNWKEECGGQGRRRGRGGEEPDWSWVCLIY